MTQPPALLAPPSWEPAGEEKNVLAATVARKAVQDLEGIPLAERVEHALRATGYPPLRGVEIVVCNQVVILHGRVPSYYLKQLAQTTALDVPGVQELRNDLDVVRLG